MRQEALPVAYQKTIFRLDDIDAVIRLLLTIGTIGRSNIGFLEFSWQSFSEMECQRLPPPETIGPPLNLPKLHAQRCIRLLRECQKLRTLRLLFDRDLVLALPIQAYQADIGLCGLRSLTSVRILEVLDLDGKPIEDGDFKR
jgi:hypothetical protein